MGRIAAIDYGMKRIGIAISDMGKKIAFPLQTVENGPQVMEAIKKAFASKEGSVELILIGLPLLMTGKPGEMALAVTQFGQKLEKALAIPIRLIDERLSSKMMDKELKQIHLNRKARTKKLDEAAAAHLLQSYLDTL